MFLFSYFLVENKDAMLVTEYLILIKKMDYFFTCLVSITNRHIKVQNYQIIELLWLGVKLAIDEFECLMSIQSFVDFALLGLFKQKAHHFKLNLFIVCN